MNRIQKKFKELQKRGEKALITFITAGDPALSITEKLVLRLEKAGADLIELGVPFSDPMADGPVIQRSSERALKNKTTPKDILKLVKKIRKSSNIPIILMGYFNPILQFGCDRFCREASQAGVDGLIVVDLPPEESNELHQPARKWGIDLIYLLTPTANAERISKVKARALGFVYYVSMTGITGAKLGAVDSIRRHVKEIKISLRIPLCVGFGIRTPQDAKVLASVAEGVVVGSALVALLEKGRKSGVERVVKMVESLKKAIRS